MNQKQFTGVTLRAGERLSHGWHLIGAGPARFGWALYTVAGAGTFLGHVAATARAHAEITKRGNVNTTTNTGSK